MRNITSSTNLSYKIQQDSAQQWQVSRISRINTEARGEEKAEL